MLGKGMEPSVSIPAGEMRVGRGAQSKKRPPIHQVGGVTVSSIVQAPGSARDPA